MLSGFIEVNVVEEKIVVGVEESFDVLVVVEYECILLLFDCMKEFVYGELIEIILFKVW